MFEKVNPSHPDKVADTIAGAIVDLAYAKENNPKIAVEVLIGHGICHIIAETSVQFKESEIESIVRSRTSKNMKLDFKQVKQDAHLAQNQEKKIKCGDNGIFKGVPLNDEEIALSQFARELYYNYYLWDGKYIYDSEERRLIVCQSHADNDYLTNVCKSIFKKPLFHLQVNPLGEWMGGTDVDTGCTNRKLGSDMGRSVTGGGLHGKDLSKADVSVNIYAFLKAQATQQEVNLKCAIGDEKVDGKPYNEIVEIARQYVFGVLGGFEGLAKWGLI